MHTGMEKKPSQREKFEKAARELGVIRTRSPGMSSLGRL